MHYRNKLISAFDKRNEFPCICEPLLISMKNRVEVLVEGFGYMGTVIVIRVE